MKGILPSEASAAGNSSFGWVYILSIIIKEEKFDWLKGFAVSVCVTGVILLAWAGTKNGKMTFNAAVLVEILCSFLWAVYLVLFRKYATRGGKYT